MADWADEQKWEAEWWGDCLRTFGEEAKQITYAHRMGLVVVPHHHWPLYDLAGARVLDIGGGPVSILLKCRNLGEASTVLDPLEVPDWVRERYQHAGIELVQSPAEELTYTGFDEVWIYNVLQHVQDPEKICYLAREAAPLIRVFEWVDTLPTEGHPHMLRRAELERWLGGELGQENFVGENDCKGPAAYGTVVRSLVQAEGT